MNDVTDEVGELIRRNQERSRVTWGTRLLWWAMVGIILIVLFFIFMNVAY